MFHRRALVPSLAVRSGSSEPVAPAVPLARLARIAPLARVALLALATLLLASGPAAASLTTVGGPSAPARRYGIARVRYEPPVTPELREMATDIRTGRFLEAIADSINVPLVLPEDLTLIAAECGTVDAFYLPDERTITLCYELVGCFADLHLRAAEAEAGDGGEVDFEAILTAVVGATEFVIYHEVGHALIHLLELPITGREEDAVDELATVVLLGAGDEASTVAALDGAYTFLLQGVGAVETEGGGGRELAFWDEHSLDPQRFANVTCWIYGSDPEFFRAMVGEELLPEARAARCPAEWRQTAGSWARRLAPHTRP